VLWQSRLPQRSLPDSHYHYDGDSHYHYDGDSHYHYVDEHNLDVDNDLFRPTEWGLLHRGQSVL
jgi:hypothetical protein